ncbi:MULTISPECIES: hypothetical protein [unclassified Crossiella]|uniref:hypothetical protein n=1 Tax=unclassified Crossiella TaxID=2620835 RepID=UPI001FFEC940|nr:MULTISPECIES: hypothetical protein [unclassified Crossiella]MCK2237596.1 hypothetical protein [Crossiella sp. S99.2]MCK2254882.1 hypothetical protein [Crossiella sp. S99.1]
MLRPVIELDDLSFLPISGSLTPAELDQVLTRMAGYLDDEADPLTALLDSDGIVVAGGLLVTDPATGAVIEPSCCCGLEAWTDWAAVLTGHKANLGHSPDSWAELRDGVVQVHVDRDPAPARIDLPAAALPALLLAVQRDLTDFLGLVPNWAPPERADELVRLLDQELRITEPLGLPG